jgi:hypothetical protein
MHCVDRSHNKESGATSGILQKVTDAVILRLCSMEECDD